MKARARRRLRDEGLVEIADEQVPAPRRQLPSGKIVMRPAAPFSIDEVAALRMPAEFAASASDARSVALCAEAQKRPLHLRSKGAAESGGAVVRHAHDVDTGLLHRELPPGRETLLRRQPFCGEFESLATRVPPLCYAALTTMKAG